MARVAEQAARAYTTAGGVCMDNNSTQQVEVIHTVPKMTQSDRKITEKRIANDLFDVLSDIYAKLQLESE